MSSILHILRNFVRVMGAAAFTVLVTLTPAAAQQLRAGVGVEIDVRVGDAGELLADEI